MAYANLAMLSMTPDQAVQQLVSIISNCGSDPPSEDDTYRALQNAGVPKDAADRVYKFTQIACARKFLDGMGITFSNDYVCFNRFGDIVDSGHLSEEPFFCSAMENAGPEQMGDDAFTVFALMSSDVQAVNNALNDGSHPADLVTSPAFLFDAGLRRQPG